MRFLIDTHTFIWYIQNSEQLTTSATAIINNGSNKILLSTASIWEMAIKQSIRFLSDSKNLVNIDLYLNALFLRNKQCCRSSLQLIDNIAEAVLDCYTRTVNSTSLSR
jgi:PIN domain nuclease of toxin-antitoxin system